MMTINTFSKRSGLSKSALRYYEFEGLLHPARSESGYRLYSEDQIRTAQLIQSLRLVHISLADIRRYLKENAQARKTLMQNWIGDLKRKHQLLTVSLQFLESFNDSERIYLMENEAETIVWFAAEAPIGKFSEHLYKGATLLEQAKISYHNSYLKYLTGLESIKALIGYGITYPNAKKAGKIESVHLIEHLPASLCLALPFTGQISKIAEAYTDLMKYAFNHEWIAAGPIIEKYSGTDFTHLEILLPVAQLTKVEGEKRDES